MRAYVPAIVLFVLSAFAFVYAMGQTLGDDCPKMPTPTRRGVRAGLATVCVLLIVAVTGGVPPLPACPLEDSPRCIWLGSVRGNGILN